MGNLIEGLKRGAKAIKESFDTKGKYEAGGRRVVCPHCNNVIFDKGEAQLNTQSATLLGLDWLNKSAVVLVCTNCGLIQWFGIEPEKIEE